MVCFLIIRLTLFSRPLWEAIKKKKSKKETSKARVSMKNALHLNLDFLYEKIKDNPYNINLGARQRNICQNKMYLP